MYKVIKAFAIAGLLVLAGCSTGRNATKMNANGFPAVDQKGKVAIVAHRGFWQCDEGGFSENSIAALKAAQDYGFWGSECDIHITADNVIIVNHDDKINGKLIWDHNYADFDKDLLPNGEKRPTFQQYLEQLSRSTVTKLVIEFKIQKNQEREDLMVDNTIKMLKEYGLYDPKRVAFISFGRHMCQKIAAEHPQFINQFLSGKIAPATMASEKINGIDYHYSNFELWPEFVGAAHDLGMTVNAWTVDKEDKIQKMIDLKVDAITTNTPLKVRELLGKDEFRIRK
ncbi:MAG: glycerophosphodiester phosphodiesterase [Bacteroidales bacterium]|nr:glycerophosphodiester phosphodiesterase [Bacteroidales bacterium]